MKVIGRKRIPLARLRFPKVEEDRVFRPEELYWQTPVARPVVDDPTKDAELVVGRHAVRNAMAKGAVDIQVKLIHCSDNEFKFFTQADVLSAKPLPENPNDTAVITMRELEAHMKGFDPQLMRTGSAGRPITIVGMIRALIATQRGVGRDALIHAARRRTDKPKGREKKIETLQTEALITFGLELDETWAGEIQKIQATLYQLEGYLNQASRLARTLKELDVPLPRYNEIEGVLSNARTVIRHTRPASICPYCKGVDSIQKDCGHCLGTGWSSRDQNTRVDPRLLKGGDDCVVMDHGLMKSIEAFLGEPDTEEETELDPDEAEGF